MDNTNDTELPWWAAALGSPVSASSSSAPVKRPSHEGGRNASAPLHDPVSTQDDTTTKNNEAALAHRMRQATDLEQRGMLDAYQAYVLKDMVAREAGGSSNNQDDGGTLATAWAKHDAGDASALLALVNDNIVTHMPNNLDLLEDLGFCEMELDETGQLAMPTSSSSTTPAADVKAEPAATSSLPSPPSSSAAAFEVKQESSPSSSSFSAPLIVLPPAAPSLPPPTLLPPPVPTAAAAMQQQQQQQPHPAAAAPAPIPTHPPPPPPRPQHPPPNQVPFLPTSMYHHPMLAAAAAWGGQMLPQPQQYLWATLPNGMSTPVCAYPPPPLAGLDTTLLPTPGTATRLPLNPALFLPPTVVPPTHHNQPTPAQLAAIMASLSKGMTVDELYMSKLMAASQAWAAGLPPSYAPGLQHRMPMPPPSSSLSSLHPPNRHGSSTGGLPTKHYVGAYSPKSRKERIARWVEKRQNRNWDTKKRKGPYMGRKDLGTMVRVRGRFTKKVVVVEGEEEEQKEEEALPAVGSGSDMGSTDLEEEEEEEEEVGGEDKLGVDAFFDLSPVDAEDDYKPLFSTTPGKAGAQMGGDSMSFDISF